MVKDWGVARFYGLGSMEYLLESGFWLSDRSLFDGAPILLFDSMAAADVHAQRFSGAGQPHGVQFMIDAAGKVVTAEKSKAKSQTESRSPATRWRNGRPK